MIDEIVVHERTFTDDKSIAENFNLFFSKIGSSLADTFVSNDGFNSFLTEN